jgi:hypothetical protein
VAAGAFVAAVRFVGAFVAAVGFVGAFVAGMVPADGFVVGSGSACPGLADFTPDTARRSPPVTQSPAPIVRLLPAAHHRGHTMGEDTRVTAFRGTIRVRPAAHCDAVGGRAPAARPGDPPALGVRVRARPVDGAATAAAERVLAEALGVRPRQVRVIRGATSREKLVEISDPPPDLAARWARLLGE